MTKKLPRASCDAKSNTLRFARALQNLREPQTFLMIVNLAKFQTSSTRHHTVFKRHTVLSICDLVNSPVSI